MTKSFEMLCLQVLLVSVFSKVIHSSSSICSDEPVRLAAISAITRMMAFFTYVGVSCSCINMLVPQYTIIKIASLNTLNHLNYRPVSKLLFLSKILEKAVLQLQPHSTYTESLIHFRLMVVIMHYCYY